MAPLGDLDAYLARIGVARPASFADVHRAHATVLPFENFDPYAGVTPSLELGRLEQKMVAARRGGYCFEHNLLFKGALEALGVGEVSPMLARVRAGAGGEPGPLNHLLLSVVAEGRTWVADVGFGGAGLLEPLLFETGRETEQSGWRYQLVEDGREVVLQTFQDGAWADLYGFVPEPVEFADIEVANWYTATHPDSIFVTTVFAGARRPERCLTVFVSDTATLIERTHEGSSAATLPFDEVPAFFAERIGLTVALGADRRLHIAESLGAGT